MERDLRRNHIQAIRVFNRKAAEDCRSPKASPIRGAAEPRGVKVMLGYYRLLGLGSGIALGEDALGLALPKIFIGGAVFWVFVAENGDREERGVDRASFADGQSPHRDATGHLDNGEQRIKSLESGLHRH